MRGGVEVVRSGKGWVVVGCVCMCVCVCVGGGVTLFPDRDTCSGLTPAEGNRLERERKSHEEVESSVIKPEGRSARELISSCERAGIAEINTHCP